MNKLRHCHRMFTNTQTRNEAVHWIYAATSLLTCQFVFDINNAWPAMMGLYHSETLRLIPFCYVGTDVTLLRKK